MKVAEAVEKVRKRKQTPEKARILTYINSRPDQVFSRTEIAQELGINVETVRRHLHQLRVSKLIKNKAVEGAHMRFYGTAKAIDDFERHLKAEGLIQNEKRNEN
jgi:predicted ArsR family transcriptional regulator